MSKHKHYHALKNPMQMLQHIRRERIGLMDPGRTLVKKKTLAGAVNTDEGKETPKDTKINTRSAPIVSGVGKGSQA